MSVEAWIGSITGVVVALGTAILVVYTPFGPAARRIGVAVGEAIWGRLRRVQIRLDFEFRRHPALIVASLILLAAWSLASPSLLAALDAWPPWRWIAIAGAAVVSVLAIVVAYRQQPGAVESMITRRPLDADSEALERARRQQDLLRQAYALAAAMLKYVPDSPGLVPWDDVQQFNGLIYRLLGEGLDLRSFEVPYTWGFQPGSDSKRFVEGDRVASKLEGLVIYGKNAGLTGEPRPRMLRF